MLYDDFVCDEDVFAQLVYLHANVSVVHVEIMKGLVVEADFFKKFFFETHPATVDCSYTLQADSAIISGELVDVIVHGRLNRGVTLDEV